MKNARDLKAKLREELVPLFERFEMEEGLVGEIARRKFAAAGPEYKDLLCIGINPSYLQDHKPEWFFYSAEEAVGEYSKHYKRFDDVVKETYPQNWGYADLLFLRETDQKRVRALLNQPAGLDFISGQLRISQRLLEDLQPKVILVANSDARRFFGADKKKNGKGNWEQLWMGYELAFDEELGVDLITGIHPENIAGLKTTSLTGVPVVFTGALTYMDTSSKRRLAWLLSKIKKNYSRRFGTAYGRESSIDSLTEHGLHLVKELEALVDRKLKLAAEGHYEQAGNAFYRQKELIGKVNQVLERLAVGV